MMTRGPESLIAGSRAFSGTGGSGNSLRKSYSVSVQWENLSVRKAEKSENTDTLALFCGSALADVLRPVAGATKKEARDLSSDRFHRAKEGAAMRRFTRSATLERLEQVALRSLGAAHLRELPDLKSFPDQKKSVPKNQQSVQSRTSFVGYRKNQFGGCRRRPSESNERRRTR